MHFHVLTLFPEMIEQGMAESIMGRAQKNGAITLDVVNIRDYAGNKHGQVDDYPYGGGAGMVMQPQPIYDAYQSVREKIDRDGKKPVRVLYMNPQGVQFTQSLANELAKEEDLIFLCGHYEGVDERVLSEIVTDHISIGDYVLTGGELPAMVMMDTISRLVGGVLHNAESAENETFQNYLLEYPQYTRPASFMGKEVPEVLLSGHHERIAAWRKEQSIARTKQYRPDLYAQYMKQDKED